MNILIFSVVTLFVLLVALIPDIRKFFLNAWQIFLQLVVAFTPLCILLAAAIIPTITIILVTLLAIKFLFFG